MKGEFSIEKIVSILLILIVLILLIVGINAIKDKIYKSTEDIFSMNSFLAFSKSFGSTTPVASLPFKLT